MGTFRWAPATSPALLLPPQPAETQGRGPEALHSTQEGYWEDWVWNVEPQGRVWPQSPAPVTPALPHQRRTDSPDPSVSAHKRIAVTVVPTFRSLTLLSTRRPHQAEGQPSAPCPSTVSIHITRRLSPTQEPRHWVASHEQFSLTGEARGARLCPH